MRRIVVLGLIIAGCGSTPPREEARATQASGGETAPRAEAVDDGPEEAVASVPEDDAPRAPIVPEHGPLGEDDLHRGILARLADPRFPSCVVSALPPALRRRSQEVDDAALRRSVSMELPETTVSAGRAENRELAIYLSPRLDPASEIGDLGYRALLRDGTGSVEDLSLGLSAMRPFVLLHNPMLPLIEDGAIQLEVQLRALDDASIDFQPAEGVTTTRDGREHMVRCELADLRRDQDRDGLTDLEEQRLATDAWDPDTDGDGVRDGDDRAPLANAAATTPADAVWLATYRTIVRPAAEGGLLLAVRSGPRLDVGAGADGRVLVLREDELGAYQRRFGLRAPFIVAVTMRGADRATVNVDDAWHESTYDGRRDSAGTWTITPRPGRTARAD